MLERSSSHQESWSPEFVDHLLRCTDYRQFLSQFIKQPGKIISWSNPRPITLAHFSRRAGFSSRSFIGDVLNRKKKLGPTSIEKVMEALKLPREWRLFFLELLSFEDASPSEKSYTRLNKIKERILHKSVAVSNKAPPLAFQEHALSEDFKSDLQSVIQKHPSNGSLYFTGSFYLSEADMKKFNSDLNDLLSDLIYFSSSNPDAQLMKLNLCLIPAQSFNERLEAR